MESGINKNLNILIISSLSPYKSANLGLDMMNALQKNGHSVDFLSKYKHENMYDNMFFVYNTFEPLKKDANIVRSILKKYPIIKKFYRFLFPLKTSSLQVIVNEKEDVPPVNDKLILQAIKKKYDLVITLFWQYMMTTKTLESLYNRLQVPIFIYAVDMFPLTGGCFYFWDCRNFLKNCGNCPAMGRKANKTDQTYINFEFKRQIYSKIEYLFIGNTWMCSWALQSPLMNNKCIKKGLAIVNEELFCVRNTTSVRTLLGIPNNKKFVIFAGAASLTNCRKGFEILISAINFFSNMHTELQKSEMLLLLAGKCEGDIQKLFDIEVNALGFLDTERLALTYSASDIFLSPSLEDAGPTMVNQSVMSGTPVVSFDIGVSVDLIHLNKTGYKAKNFDVYDYARGINYLYCLSEEEKREMKRNCREIALKYCSFVSLTSSIEEFYGSFEH